ncbi:RING finger protein 37 [Diorhabda carinulata]|uniref:RING finger protein 37 n=1 Tax=Diorhabda carinulata TaxID=1163345 RepID=UPI0025A29EB9|nr:RING finger protein 37 [Diorhabda carinulata]
MFNFVDSKLAPKVSCKSPATENYEVDNLISSNSLDRIRGFISYPSIKPPVDVEFVFLCPVNIHYIVLNTTVGNQKCSGIELFAKTEHLDYTSIGKSVYNAAGVIFCNSRKYSKYDSYPNFNTSFQKVFFKSDTFKYFLNATGIKVLIFRTDKSVPCLGSVEVWGIPSKTCSKVTVNTITKLATNRCTEFSPTQTIKTEEFIIPEDFKDDLTYEIMTIPMTLPCGKTIDQSTLEKHLESEKCFGRKPCDPFTGVKFNDSLKPVMNVALKSRIDMFMLQNSHRPELLTTKRILGRAISNSSESDTSRERMSVQCDDGDLEVAIANAKRSANFTIFTSDESNSTINKCGACKTESNFLYKIPCNHLFCRSCLLELCQSLVCSICNKSFVKNEVKKCYF